jgi:transglutaminase-like putative cysteine protease
MDFTSEVVAELNKNAPAGATPASPRQEPGKNGPENKSAGNDSSGAQNVKGSVAQAHSGSPLSPRHPDANDTYTITSTLELAKPFNVEDMNDPFQDARVISQTADSCIVEITYYPLFRPEIGENPNWRKDYAGMTEYLRPTPTENWDEKMRADLLVELRAAGIDPDQLTDKQLVEQVSRWAIRRTRTTDAFSIWTLHYPEGKPTVFPPLRSAFERIQGKTGLTEQQMIDQEALGRSMYYGKVRGSCTSSSVYLTTIFRALGIPTRIVFCDPPFDPNDPKQAEMFYGAIRHHQVRETVRAALDGMTGSCNHLFNEVYVGGTWVRLNYSTLGQPILDSHYFGLLTHIFTTSDLSGVPLAETWGMRYFRYAEAQPLLSSVNPYRLIAVSDRFGENARVPKPEVPVAELRTVTIVGLIRPGDKRVPESFAKTWQPKSELNFLISAKEWVQGTYRQMRTFEQRASHDFLLTARDHPEVRARLTRLTMSKGDGAFQAYEAEVLPGDRAKVVSGVGYTIKPINSSATYRWKVAEDLGAIAFQD